MTPDKRGLRILSLILGAALIVAPARADEDTPPADGTIVFGPQWYVDQSNPDSAKFEEFRDVPNGFVTEWLSFDWTPRARSYFNLTARDVSQRDQKIGVEFGRIDLWRGTFRWSENPRRWTDESRSLFAHQGDGVFTLPDSFQADVLAGGANVDADADNIWDPGSKGRVVQLGVAEGAGSVFIGSQRRTGGVGFEYTPTRRWTFTLSADRERRSGTTPQTLGFYFNFAPAEVAAPLDLRTDWITGTAEYATRRFNLGAQFGVSAFETNYDTLTWDNQMIPVDGAGAAVTANAANPGHGRMALGADNRSTRMALYGGLNLPGRTRLDVSASRVETTQDDPFLPMTINTLLTPSPLPASSYDGRHETTTAQVRVSSRPLTTFRWSAWARLFDLHNDSPSPTFADYVQTDYQFPICNNVNVCDGNGNTVADDRISRRSLPYGFERRNAGFSVGWTPVRWLDTTVGLERENMTREFSAVEDSHEDTARLTFDFDLGSRLDMRTTLRHQERRADHYDAHYLEESFPIGEAVEAGFNEGMRRFYWTDRDRDAASLMLDWTVLETLSIYVEGTYQNDDYTDPDTGKAIGDSITVSEDRDFNGIDETYTILLAGRTEDRSTSYSLGFSFAPAPRFNLYADYTWEKWKYGLESRYRNVAAGIGTDNPLDNWGSDTQDDYGTASLGFDYRLTRDAKWRLNLDASRSEGTGEIRTHFVPGGAAAGDTTLTMFPRLRTDLTLAVATLTHVVRSNLDYRLRYWYEAWDERNFASDFNEPYMGAPNQDPSMAQAIFLGLDFRNYSNHILSFLVRYSY